MSLREASLLQRFVFLFVLREIWKFWKNKFGETGHKSDIGTRTSLTSCSNGDHVPTTSLECAIQKTEIRDEQPKPNVLDLDDLPNEMLHRILDQLPPDFNMKSLRLVSRRWEFVVSGRFNFLPQLSDSSVKQFDEFLENTIGKKVTAVRIGVIKEAEVASSNHIFPEETEIAIFESLNLRPAITNASAIVKRFQNLKTLTFKKYEPCNPNKINLHQLFQENDMSSLKELALVRPYDTSHHSVIMDLNFTAFLPGLESLHLMQMYNSSLLNLNVVPVCLKVLELCVAVVNQRLVTSILDHLPKLEKLLLASELLVIRPTPGQEPYLQISLDTIKDLLQRPNLKCFNCIPAVLALQVDDLRRQTQEIKMDRQSVRFWFGQDKYHFILRIIKK